MQMQAAGVSGPRLECRLRSLQLQNQPEIKLSLSLINSNIVDVVHLLEDSLGADHSQNIGGFSHKGDDPDHLDELEDWVACYGVQQGNVYSSQEWEPQLLTLAGSQPLHDCDDQTMGGWHPSGYDLDCDSTNFLVNDPGRLPYLGGGCILSLYGTCANCRSATDIITYVTALANAIDAGSGSFSHEGFYSTTIMLNQGDFQIPGYVAAVTNIINTLESNVGSKIEWATFTEKLEAFNQWKVRQVILGSGLTHWQVPNVSCDPALLRKSPTEEAVNDNLKLYPNPAGDRVTVATPQDEDCKLTIVDLTGRVVLQLRHVSGASVDISALPTGVYVMKADLVETGRVSTSRLIKL